MSPPHKDSQVVCIKGGYAPIFGAKGELIKDNESKSHMLTLMLE